MEINGREYTEFHRRLRFSNLLSLAEDASVDVTIQMPPRMSQHIEGRILEHQITDEQASLSVDCEGFVMMLDVGNIIQISYDPDDDRFTLWVQDRTTVRFQPVITPTEVVEYLADQVLDEAEDEHEEMPEWLAELRPPEPPDYDLLKASALELGNDEHTGVPGCLCHNCTDEDDINGDDWEAFPHEDEQEDTQVTDAHTRMQMHIKAENDEEGGEDTE